MKFIDLKLYILADRIHHLRGQKVMLDRDLAELYGIETRHLVQAVRRNVERFPTDFMFQLKELEVTNLRSQIVISSWGPDTAPGHADIQGFAVDSAQISIDGQLVAHHIYRFKELEAFAKGGVQRIYTGSG